MTATMTTAAGILKEVYEGGVNDQLQHEAVTHKRIEATSEDIFENAGGKWTVFPVRTKRNHGISYRDENTQLAPARRQGYAYARESLCSGYGQVRITGQLMDLADTNEKAFINGAEAEIDRMKEDLARDCNRIIVGNRTAFAAVGSTGIITRIDANSVSTTLTVEDSFQLEVDMVIDIVDNSGVPVAGGVGRVITGVPSATTVTVDSAVAGAVIDNNIVRTGNFGKEPYGVLPLVGTTGTIHQINSGTTGNEYWQSVVDTTTTTLTEASMIKVMDDVKKKAGKAPTAIFTSQGCRRTYYNIMALLRRYTEHKTFEGGLVGMVFTYDKELPLVVDVDFPTKHMLFLNEKEVRIYRPKPWSWQDKDGNMFKWVSGYDAWEAMIKQYWQVVTHQRNAHGLMTNITEA
jgi:hypothetical protein